MAAIEIAEFALNIRRRTPGRYRYHHGSISRELEVQNPDPDSVMFYHGYEPVLM
jgi:hypothetical protein